MPTITVNNTDHFFRLRRSVRSKRLALAIRPFGFEVVAPYQIKNKEILRFVWEYRYWMHKHSKKKSTLDSTQYAWPAIYENGQTLPFRSQRIVIEIKYSDTSQIQLKDNQLVITVALSHMPSQSGQIIKQLIKSWYQQQAFAAIDASLKEICPKVGRWPKDFQLKQQKTRWGSCGIQDIIYINWLLLLAPYGILEYVVAHEVCHLFHRNHGKRFWAKVANCFPDYEAAERWLKHNGHVLTAL